MPATNVQEIKRISVTSSYQTYTIPDEVQYVLIRNTSVTDIKMNIKGKERADYVLIRSLDYVPTIEVLPGAQFEFVTASLTGELELLMWG